MAAYPRITLRYFDCRGRAQYLRAFLRARNITFIDDRVPLNPGWPEWQAIKSDRSLTGPFQKLPVLQWGDVLVAESPVIHDWLHRKSGDADRLSEKEQLQHAMLASSCASELMLPLGMLLYVDLSHEGADLALQARNTVNRVRTHLQTMEQVLTDWKWCDNLAVRGAMIADCQLWEVLDCSAHIYGESLQLQAFPELYRFYRECPGREQFMALLSEHSACPITGRPAEAEAIARIRLALNVVNTPA
jgi:glutathione S-transferase